MENKKKITDTEYIVLQVLWKSEKAMSVNEINEQLKENGVNWAHSTVATILKRMNKKNLVEFEQINRTFYYHSVTEATDVVSGARKYINRYFQGSLSRFLTAFTKDDQLTSEDIEALKEWVDKLDDK